jgi:NADH:ubiquinone oxidoreductase subunit
MKNFFISVFSWWNKATVGTRFFTWRKGEFVGEDEFGNRYYRAANVPPLGERRWVIYSGYAEASAIPSGWHGWMHHTTDVLPSDEAYQAREWQLPHCQNMTGTPEAYRPSGSVLRSGQRPAATGDYDAWTPS